MSAVATADRSECVLHDGAPPEDTLQVGAQTDHDQTDRARSDCAPSDPGQTGRAQTGGEQPDRANCDEPCLVALCHAGDDEAFAELYRRHRAAAVRFASRVVRDPHLAEDIAQQALLKAFRAIGQFQHRSTFQTWLYRLTINEAFSQLRRRCWSEVPVPMGWHRAGATAASPEEEAGRHELQSVVQRAVTGLHPQLRTVVAYKYYHGLTDVEIARLLGCPAGTVKSRLHRARHRLRVLLPVDLGRG